MALSLFVFLMLLSQQSWLVLSQFDGQPGDTDVFRNPDCASSSSCNCAVYKAQCVHSDCRECKCRKSTRIYRPDLRKCTSDIEARDPSCSYQFLGIESDIIPTIDVSIPCGKERTCSREINAPLDKSKTSCITEWVSYVQNETKWLDQPVSEFKKEFNLRRQRQFYAENKYLYAFEWKISNASYIPSRFFQVSLECSSGKDAQKETFCLMFRTKGKGEPKSEIVRAPTIRPTKSIKKPTTVFTTRYTRRRLKTPPEKVVVVSDNFAVILAAIAGAVGTAVVVIPLVLFCRRTSATPSGRCNSKHCAQHEHGNFEQVEVDVGTSEETLSSYTSLKRNREDDVPPSVYQSLNKTEEIDLPSEEPIYISVSGDEGEVQPLKPPPVYHVLENLERERSSRRNVDR